MNASLEITGAVVRVHPSGGFGDPWDLAVTITGDEGVATIKALAAPITTAARRAIFACLRAAGFNAVRWTRHEPDGRVREVRARLADPSRQMGMIDGILDDYEPALRMLADSKE